MIRDSNTPVQHITALRQTADYRQRFPDKIKKIYNPVIQDDNAISLLIENGIRLVDSHRRRVTRENEKSFLLVLSGTSKRFSRPCLKTVKRFAVLKI